MAKSTSGYPLEIAESRKTTHQGEAKSALAYIRSKSDTVILDANSDTAIGRVCDAYEDFA